MFLSSSEKNFTTHGPLDLGPPSLQNCEPNKFLFSTNHPVCGIFLYQNSIDEDTMGPVNKQGDIADKIKEDSTKVVKLLT